MSWYVIFVETGHEDDVCLFIDKVRTYLFDDIQYSLLIPKRKIYERKQGVRREVTKRLFPGYVLLETERIIDFYRKVRESPHIIKFLKDGRDFLEVEKREITPILHMTNKEGLIGISQAFIENDKIIITEGPLLDREGIIKKIDKRKGRAKVEFLINGNPMFIDLGVNIFRKITE